MAGHTMETADETAPEDLPVPRKMNRVGNVSLQITASREAQMWFNQGLNLIHDFWDYESARAFEQSIRVDPQCAMCYWGLYKAESFYHSTAQGYAGQALAKAVSLKDRVSERERLYIEATAAGESAAKSGNPSASFSQEVELWRKLVKAYPQDTQARIALAGVVDRKEALELLESVMREDPSNSAANHYYIHDLEASEHPEQALHSAEILGSLAPASGHIVHMPGHIFFRLGDYSRAEQAFTASMQVDERYMQEQQVQPDNDWNYVHNLMYAIANFMEEGKFQEATALSLKLTDARGKLESTLYIYSVRDSISRLNCRLPVALRTADWSQVIELSNESAPPAERPHLQFLARQLARFAAGMQAVETHDLVKAEEASSRFDAELWRLSQQEKALPGLSEHAAPSGQIPKLQLMPDALLHPLLSSLSIMSLELRASLLAARKKTDEAKSLFATATQEEKALGYREPPSYIRPVGETEGAAMMAVGDWTSAKAAYRRALQERPRSGLVLYDLAMTSEKSGDTEAATNGYKDFLSAWKSANPALPQLAHAQAYLAGHL